MRVHHRTLPDGSLADVTDWGMELIDITGGANKIYPLQEISIGAEGYTALTQVYERRRSSKARNVYVLWSNRSQL